MHLLAGASGSKVDDGQPGYGMPVFVTYLGWDIVIPQCSKRSHPIFSMPLHLLGASAWQDLPRMAFLDMQVALA